MLEAIHAHASQQDLKARKSSEEAEQALSEFMEKRYQEMESVVTEVYLQHAQNVVEKQRAVAASQLESEQVCVCVCVCLHVCIYGCDICEGMYSHTYCHSQNN
jgi:hypothetical protein